MCTPPCSHCFMAVILPRDIVSQVCHCVGYSLLPTEICTWKCQYLKMQNCYASATVQSWLRLIFQLSLASHASIISVGKSSHHTEALIIIDSLLWCAPLRVIVSTHKPQRKMWPSAITRLMAHFICGLLFNLVICKHRIVCLCITPNVHAKIRCH